MHATPTPLDDAGLQRFLRDGYITLDAGLPADFHQRLYEEVDGVFESEGNPGNNILPRLPAIRRVLDSPPVRGALQSLLGTDFYLHAHRFCHYRQPQTDAQRLHKDSWSRRHHRTRWCMAFYYPQDTTQDMGPTGVVPGSQYYNTQPDLADEVPLAGCAGTVALVHYDLWHRGLANNSERKRYMLKFLFTRLDEPAANGHGAESFDGDDPRAPLWRSMWRWHVGGESPSGQDLPEVEVGKLAAHLGSEDETACFYAAYRLAEAGAVGALIDGLRTGDEMSKRNAGYGLTAAGSAAVPGLLACLEHEQAGVRVAAVDALGHMGVQAAAAVPAVAGRLSGEDNLEVRRLAAFALGTMGAAAGQAVPQLAAATGEEDEWMARNASLSLARLGAAAEEAVPALGEALEHPNRYVQANAIKSLERIDSHASRKLLYEYLATARWCPITSNGTPY